MLSISQWQHWHSHGSIPGNFPVFSEGPSDHRGARFVHLQEAWLHQFPLVVGRNSSELVCWDVAHGLVCELEDFPLVQVVGRSVHYEVRFDCIVPKVVGVVVGYFDTNHGPN